MWLGSTWWPSVGWAGLLCCKFCFLCWSACVETAETHVVNTLSPHFSSTNVLTNTFNSFVSSYISTDLTNFHSTMDSAFINSLVGDYLSTFGSKLADKFRKETKSSPLPPGSPGLADVVKHFKETSPAKRKLSLSNGTPAKKAKKVRI